MDKFQATIDGRLFDFSGLVPLYGADAVARLASAWTQQFVGSRESVCAARFRAFTRFLKWIAARAEVEPNSSEAAFFNGFQQGQAERLTKEIVYEAGEAWARRVAAQTIVMIDTAFNVTTCDELAADPFIGKVQRGKVRIITVAAAKLRARGEIQEGHLLEGTHQRGERSR